jgi:hypothetical protein
MAKDKAFSTNAEVKRNDDFQKMTDIKYEVGDIIKELLVSETDRAFKEAGIEKTDKPAGVYGNGKAYGFGAHEGRYNVKVQGVTFTSFTKEIVYGGKKMLSDINMVYEANLLMVQYKTTEAGIFRGIKEKNGQSFTFHKKYILKTNDIGAIKKTLKKIFFEIAEKEVDFLITTKLGVGDKEEAGTQSSVNESKNINKMNKLTIKELFSDDEKMISEGKKDGDDVKPNINPVKKANTVILKNGKKKDMTMFLDAEKSKEEGSVEEMTGTAGAGAGSAGGFRYDTPFFAAADKEKKTKFESTPYAKSKNAPKRTVDKDYNTVVKEKKGDGFYTQVELEPNSGYVPKGMKQNTILGMHNATPEQLAKYGYAEGQFGVNENKNKPDLTKKKIFSESENIEKGVNKKYLITEKTTDEYQKERWSKLSNFKIYESIREAEEVVNPEEYDELPPVAPKANLSEAEYFERDMTAPEETKPHGEEHIDVEKPSSMFGTTYRFYKNDFLNESKRYILDLNTMAFVKNPNFR